MAKMRVETDSMGQMQVPTNALYGAQTARAVANFPVSGWPMPRGFIAALGLVKRAAAEAHKRSGRMDAAKADAIIAAAGEVAGGELDEHFVVDVFQTGSGTSTNMNANEVIANRAIQLLGGQVGDKTVVHPNDDVNRGQSSNDVIPTVMHVSAAVGIAQRLVPTLNGLRDALAAKADQFHDVVKIGRTHGMDAVPIRLGQEMSGYVAQIEMVVTALGGAVDALCPLAIGGTAVGTGLNAPKGFAADVCAIIAENTGLAFHEVSNHFAAQGARDAAVLASGVLRATALAMGKIASDIRLLGSGPRCGLGELALAPVQPGSSIMPGKVNPVLCESVIQVACQVVGCDATIAAAATGGVGSILELNVAMPVISLNLLTAIDLMTNVADAFRTKCVEVLEANPDRCGELVEQSLAMVTVLAPRIGYDIAADIAKEALSAGKTIREICIDRGVLDPDQLDELLDACGQTD